MFPGPFDGGRYKTRTCDLPHVKRMRYQLRQSSSSAGVILTYRAAVVNLFFPGGQKNGALSCPVFKRVFDQPLT